MAKVFLNYLKREHEVPDMKVPSNSTLMIRALDQSRRFEYAVGNLGLKMAIALLAVDVVTDGKEYKRDTKEFHDFNAFITYHFASDANKAVIDERVEYFRSLISEKKEKQLATTNFLVNIISGILKG
jgi:hypothetical protein